jgi:prepilin-type N-terminal cleavage/methylation domain-containing protein
MHHKSETKGEWRMKMRKGFTLIEMLVVVAIIVALLAIIGFAGPALTKGAKVNAFKGSVKNLATALNIVEQNTGTLPAAADVLATTAPYMSGKFENPFHPGVGITIASSVGHLDDAVTAATQTTPDGGWIQYKVDTLTLSDGTTVPNYLLTYSIDGTPYTLSGSLGNHS